MAGSSNEFLSGRMPLPVLLPLRIDVSSQSCLLSKSVEGVLQGGMGRGGGAGLALWRRGLAEPPPSLSVLDEEGGGGAGRRGRELVAEGSGGMREQEEEAERRLWMRRHSWQMRTWVQPRGGGATTTGPPTEPGGCWAWTWAEGGGGGVLDTAAPSGSSRRRCGPGPMSIAGPGGPMAPPPPPAAPPPPRDGAPPVSGPMPLYSLPLLRRISRTSRKGRGPPRVRRAGCRSTAELERGRRRRERELFLQEMAFRNSDIIS